MNKITGAHCTQPYITFIPLTFSLFWWRVHFYLGLPKYILAKALDCLDYFYPFHLMANFYTHKCQVINPHFFIVSVFPYCKVSLSSFLEVLRGFCSLTIVLTIFTFNDRFSCQSLTLIKVCAPERQHLRLVSLETNSQREILTCSCNLRPILWGALGLRRLSLEVS